MMQQGGVLHVRHGADLRRLGHQRDALAGLALGGDTPSPMARSGVIGDEQCDTFLGFQEQCQPLLGAARVIGCDALVSSSQIHPVISAVFFVSAPSTESNDREKKKKRTQATASAGRRRKMNFYAQLKVGGRRRQPARRPPFATPPRAPTPPHFCHSGGFFVRPGPPPGGRRSGSFLSNIFQANPGILHPDTPTTPLHLSLILLTLIKDRGGRPWADS